jgi:hypothetical protein
VIIMGLAFGGMGTLIVLLGLGVVGHPKPGDAPPWVIVCAGFAFILGGLAVIVGYGVANGVGPDGDVAPGTPWPIRAVQYVLGLGVAVLLAVIATWVAFGPGPRHFSATGTFGRGPASEISGRIAFGAGAVLLWLFTGIVSVMSVRRLRRAGRAQLP